MPPPQDSPPYIFFINLFNTITHFLIGGVTVVTCVFGYVVTTSTSYRQHIILCVIGYILLMSQAILAFNRSNSWSSSLHYKQKVTSHLVMQIMGSSLAIAGSIIRIQGFNGTHFSTAHGIAGWLALICTCISLIGGLVNLRMKMYNRAIKTAHACLGCTTVALATICLCLGYDKATFRTWSSDDTAVTMIVLAVVTFIGTMTSAVQNMIRRLFIN